MKTKIIYIINSFLIIIGISLNSCTDLEPELYSDLTTSNAYSTESDLEAALVGVYASMGNHFHYYKGYLVMITDYATDIGHSTAAGDPTALSNFTYNSNNRYFTLNWRYMYQLISNANMVLDRIQDVEMDETNKNRIIGQAKFLRALAYLDLTDAWGPIPLITEVSNPTESYNVPLSPTSSVDALITDDCEFAVNHLPDEWDPGDGKVRATKGAALAILTKVHMRSHDYSKAKSYVDQLLKLRQQGVYTLNPDFQNEWSDDNKIDSGLIFGITHEGNFARTLLANHFGPSDHPDVPNRWQYYAVSLQFFRKYSDLDPRKQFFYYNYEGYSNRDSSTEHGFYYMVPEPGQTTPPSDTVKFLRDVATKKYTHELFSGVSNDGRTVQIFRLADIILCKAEIENELNGPSEAIPFLNEIRRKAGAPEYGKHEDFPIPSSKEEMRDVILDERGFELVFEYKRRADLIRFGKYTEICNNYLQERGLVPIVTDKMIHFPYPLDEARVHPEMAAANPERTP